MRRLIEDEVTAFGDSVDQRVVAIGRTYEVRGMLETITSYGTADSSSSSSLGDGRVVLNQVKRSYNTFGLLVAEYQEHDGEVDEQTTPVVGYSHADGSENHTRTTRMTYPNGRILRYEYSTDDDDALGRISCLADDSSGAVGTHLAEYTRLGLSAIVQVDYREPDLRYDLAHGTGDDPYDGLDRFGRVVDLLWRNYGSSTDAVRIQHGYDRAGNRLWREDPVAAGYGTDFDELYAYDGMNQLASLQRGDLNAAKDGLVANSRSFAEDWSLDMTGNWKEYKKDDDGDGSWDLDQTRTHNAVNEITAIDASVGQIWISPTHDRNGNMLRIPQPGDPMRQFALAWDAWDRLVRVSSGGESSSSSSSGSEASVVAEYDYDALMRRIVKTVYGEDGSSSSSSAGTGSEIRHFYYTARWQCVEERLNAAAAADRQFVWGLRYIDDLILRDRDVDAGGDLGKPNSGLDERLYATQDPNWNVIAVGDTTGAVAERYTYAAYGKTTFQTAAFDNQASSNYAWRSLYCSEQQDPETALYHYRRRSYGCAVGVFLSRDPLASRRRARNSYQYVSGMPTVAVDPLGLEWHHWFPNGNGVPESITKMCGDKLNRHRYTTDISGSVTQPGTWHYWLHVTKGYNRRVLEVIERSRGDCCLFLRKMLELINQLWADMWSEYQISVGQLNTSRPDLTTWPYPSRFPGARPQTTQEILPGGDVYKSICDDPCKKPSEPPANPYVNTMPWWVPEDMSNDWKQDVGIALAVVVLVPGVVYGGPAIAAGLGGTGTTAGGVGTAGAVGTASPVLVAGTGTSITTQTAVTYGSAACVTAAVVNAGGKHER